MVEPPLADPQVSACALFCRERNKGQTIYFSGREAASSQRSRKLPGFCGFAPQGRTSFLPRAEPGADKFLLWERSSPLAEVQEFFLVFGFVPTGTYELPAAGGTRGRQVSSLGEKQPTWQRSRKLPGFCGFAPRGRTTFLPRAEPGAAKFLLWERSSPLAEVQEFFLVFGFVPTGTYELPAAGGTRGQTIYFSGREAALWQRSRNSSWFLWICPSGTYELPAAGGNRGRQVSSLGEKQPPRTVSAAGGTRGRRNSS